MDWYFLTLSLASLVAMDLAMLQQLPETTRTNLVLLVFWLLVGLALGVEIWLRVGPEDGARWLEGYLLELVFSVDRTVVALWILLSLETPRRLMAKVTFLSMLGSMVVRAAFLLGLATDLDRLRVIPYAVGLWLLFSGARRIAASDEDTPDVTQTKVVAALRGLLGSRLGEFYDEEGEAIFTVAKKKACVTLLGVALLCLSSADLFLSLDLALVKAEGIGNAFLDLGSACVAAFAARALLFVVRDFLTYFDLTKNTLGAVLVVQGVQSLIAPFVQVNAVGSAGASLTILVASGMLTWARRVAQPKLRASRT